MALFTLILFFTSRLRNTKFVLKIRWSSPYECGFSSNSISLNYFSFTYFSLLVYFVIFDLEISLLLNMPDQELLYFKYLYYYTFIMMLIIGFILEIA